MWRELNAEQVNAGITVQVGDTDKRLYSSVAVQENQWIAV
jgi:hypothetical protein